MKPVITYAAAHGAFRIFADGVEVKTVTDKAELYVLQEQVMRALREQDQNGA